MTWLEIVIVVTLALSVFTGLRMGLIKAVLNLVSLVVAMILAGRFYGKVAGVLGFVPHEGATKVVAFIIIVGVVMLIASRNYTSISPSPY